MKSKEHWLSIAYDGRYKLVDSGLPSTFGPKSSIRVTLISDAGHTRHMNWRTLYYSKAKYTHPSPGSDLIGRPFGDLVVMTAPEWWWPCTKDLVRVKCACGNESEKVLLNILDGSTRSCGSCGHKTWSEWAATKYHKLNIIDSAHNDIIRASLPHRFGPGFGKTHKTDVVCECGKRARVWMYDLLTMRTLSCGCALNAQFSHASDDLYETLVALGRQVVRSHKVGRREFDFWVPELKVAIEYHGCHWHSEARRTEAEKLKDYEKYLICKRLGIDLVQIYADEWSNKKEVFADLLKRRLGWRGTRLYGLTVIEISYPVAAPFLDKHHYLGRAGGSIRLGLFCKGELVGVAIVRQHSGFLECNRFCLARGVRAYQPFGLILNWLRGKYRGTSLVSFSDNRLHSGGTYAALGFARVGEVPPDYCYTNGYKRVHKFNFRTKAGVDERSAAAARNFYRLWDSGKVKWAITL